MNRKILVLVITLLATSCSRYEHPIVTDAVPDIRSCMYQAYKVDRWGDDAYLDTCMLSRGYVMNNESRHLVWWDGIKDTFEKYDAKKASMN